MTRLRHFDDAGTARFVTFGCFRHEPNLNLPGAMSVLANSISHARDRHGFRLLGYVFMPNHVHLVLHPPDEMRLGAVIGEVKSRMARDFYAQANGPDEDRRRVFWQRRCYDHNCRTTESVREKINYCHTNPVKAELVSEPGEWPWSSYNWYRGMRDVPILIDEVEL